ncbi:MAG: CPBP family intramembrane glutamic endopeptidase [Candidatus Binataceae bacterium]
MDRTSPHRGQPLKFFLLVFVLSIPFWLAGALTTFQLAPGLPVSALMFFCPAIAASILVYGEDKGAGVTALLKRSFDFNRIGAKIWYAPIVLLMPAIYFLSYALMRVIGAPVPAAQSTLLTPIVLALMFFVPALGEELGWSGYAIDPMQDRWGALSAGILLGFVWAGWHIVPFMQAHRSPGWIAGQFLFTVAVRVLTVWLYNNTGKSVFAAAVFHDTSNVCWLLFPIQGSYYDPRITGLIAAFAAAIVAIVWGPRTLARYRTNSLTLVS